MSARLTKEEKILLQGTGYNAAEILRWFIPKYYASYGAKRELHEDILRVKLDVLLEDRKNLQDKIDKLVKELG